MIETEKIAYKNRLKQWALDHIGSRIDAAKVAIDQAQQAANQEEKSSVGDKYETARAMGHLQKDMHSRQLAEYIKELAVLHAVKTETLYTSGRSGAVVKGDNITFFIAAGLGKQQVGSDILFFLSPQAPLARLLQSKKAGDSFTFGKEQILIREVF